MKGIIQHLLRVSFVGALVLGGCGADKPPYRDPNDGSFIISPDGGMGGNFGEPADCQEATPLPPPQISNAPLTSSQARQPIRGRAPDADMVTARTAAGSATPVPVTFDGSFCVEVPLVPNQENTITLTAISEQGCIGREATVTVTQRAAAPSNNTPPPASPGNTGNLAIGMPIESRFNPSNSEPLQNVNDGNPNSAASFSFFDVPTNRGAWVQIDLAALKVVNGVRLRWAADAGTACATSFAVLVSNGLTPGTPDPSNSEWVVAAERDVPACNATQEVSLTSVQARWVAVLLYEDADNSWVAPWLGQTEYFKLAEFEILGQDPNIPTYVGDSDRCP